MPDDVLPHDFHNAIKCSDYRSVSLHMKYYYSVIILRFSYVFFLINVIFEQLKCHSIYHLPCKTVHPMPTFLLNIVLIFIEQILKIEFSVDITSSDHVDKSVVIPCLRVEMMVSNRSSFLFFFLFILFSFYFH